MHPALRPTHGLPNAVVPRRSYVSQSLLRTLERAQTLRHAREVFGFQRFSKCIPHSASMLRGAVGRLERDGVIERRPRSVLGRAVQALMVPTSEGLVSLGTPRDGADLHAMNHESGPVQVVSLGALQAGQGLGTYDFHAAVLIASLRHEGQHLGILLDGNDLQANPVVDALRAWQARSGAIDSLDQLTPGQFDAFWRANPDLDPYQCAFRVVNLDEMVQASHLGASKMALKGFNRSNPLLPSPFEEATTVLSVPDTRVNTPLLSAQEARAIEAALRIEPGQVERFRTG